MYEHDHHSHERSSGRALTGALLLTLAFAAVEGLGGWWANSLALMSDAGHMLTDASALGLAVFAAWLARRPADRRRTWGHGRAEVLAAMTNALVMLGLIATIAYHAVLRLQNPPQVQGLTVLLIATIGMCVNLLVLRVLRAGHQTLNTRGAILHVMGDLLGSVAALSSGAIILLTGWTPVDPLLSLLICMLILVSALRLLRESLNVVMEGVPRHLEVESVGRAMARVPGVSSVHDLHIWQVRSDQIALSAHVVLRSMDDWLPVLQRLNELLAHDFGIRHATLQPEPLPEEPLPHPN